MADEATLKQIDKIKNKHKILIGTILVVIIFGFLKSFVPLDKLGINLERASLNDIIRLCSSGVFSTIISFLLFGIDPLPSGRGKKSVYFRSLYPSKLISVKYGVDDGDADKLWFDYFNTWSNKDSKYYSDWRNVFKRSYTCRLIVYASCLLKYSFILSVSILLVVVITRSSGVNLSYNPGLLSYCYTISIGLIYLIIKLTNNCPKKLEENPTGCWYKYQEISAFEQSRLKGDILDNANTYREAIELLNK